ncbi:MAG: hypothetical protein ACTS73_04580 [Arsenophonus sp. NEOnobi-MAG3]
MKSLPYSYPRNQILPVTSLYELIRNGARQLISTSVKSDLEAML